MMHDEINWIEFGACCALAFAGVFFLALGVFA